MSVRNTVFDTILFSLFQEEKKGRSNADNTRQRRYALHTRRAECVEYKRLTLNLYRSDQSEKNENE